MKKRIALGAAALAAAASFMLAGAGTLATWKDTMSQAGAATIGYAQFGVGEAEASPDALASVDELPGGVEWTVSSLLADLSADNPQTAVVQIAGLSQGNRGLAYTVDDIRISGSAGLGEAADIRARIVQSPQSCSADAEGPAIAGLPAGSLEATGSHDRVLVASSYSDATWDQPEIEYLCLTASLHAGDSAGDYANTGTVTGRSDGRRAGTATVEASDTWERTKDFTTADRSADVVLGLTARTFRGDEPPGATP